MKEEPHDDLSNAIRLQNQSCELIRTISITGKSYQVFLGNDVQLQNAELFCCDNNGVYQLIHLSIFVLVGSLTLVTTIKAW